MATNAKEPNDIEEAAQHLAAIGLLAGVWSGFELSLDQNALELAKIPVAAGSCFTAQVIGPARKLDAYISIAKLRGASRRSLGDLNELAKDATALAEQRNRIVHDPWVLFGVNSPYRLEVTARRSLRLKRVPMTMSDIMHVVDNVAALRDRFSLLHSNILAAVGASP